MPKSGPRSLWALLVAAATLWHVLSVLAPPAPPLAKSVRGQQLAMVRTATGHALAHGDPYARPPRKPKAARLPRHPATLMATAWLPSLRPTEAVLIWFVLGELALLATVIVLWRAWHPSGVGAAPALAIATAASFGVGHSQLLGHDAVLAMGLVVTGAVLARASSRPQAIAGGVLLGVGLLFHVGAWGVAAVWLAQRRWTPLVVAVATAAALVAGSVGVFGTATWSRWATEVLPAVIDGRWFGDGTAAFGNHGIPGRLPVPAAASFPLLAALALVGFAMAFRRRSDDPFVDDARTACVLAVGVVVPTLSPDPQLALALPATALALTAVARGQLGMGWAAVVGGALAVLAVPNPHLQQLADKVLGGGPLGAVVQWLPTAAVLGVAAAAGTVGVGGRQEGA